MWYADLISPENKTKFPLFIKLDREREWGVNLRQSYVIYFRSTTNGQFHWSSFGSPAI